MNEEFSRNVVDQIEDFESSLNWSKIKELRLILLILINDEKIESITKKIIVQKHYNLYFFQLKHFLSIYYNAKQSGIVNFEESERGIEPDHNFKTKDNDEWDNKFEQMYQMLSYSSINYFEFKMILKMFSKVILTEDLDIQGIINQSK